MATEYQGSLQLESTPATCITINPPIPDLKNYLNSTTYRKKITVVKILDIIPAKNKQTKFACLASVIDIFNYRKWYYALCSVCTKKLYPEQDDLVCEDHGTINSPKYMYCVNATIADAT
ncbi:hypothetical protein L1987_29859 [Smallanthus sonchifolius]|uniref:Uncharacterized protein n=1 Tax=Smallanthus sonchifolius TaxID=185202 RepID=A0ACB9I2M8_9ASTR|nr:hypothetical protein L1987_29859 [Smallanthus sonchifolius]